MLPRVLGLQLPMALAASNYDQNIALQSKKVKYDFQPDIF